MAGQDRRATRATGRSRRGAWWPAVAAASGAASGSSTVPRISTGAAMPTATPATRSTYRTLLLKGLAPEEASNLTAFLCGIPVGQQWRLGEINRLLFLRELNRTGRFT
jgi:hypothetical protein